MGVKESHELKQLETRRQQLKAELDARTVARDEALKAHNAALCRLQAVEKSIAELAKRSEKPVVTEHAMLRYLERMRGLDLQALQDEILDAQTVETINALKSCRLPIGNGNQLVVENRTVKTVIPVDGSGPQKSTGQRKHAQPPSRGPKPAQRRQEQRAAESAFEEVDEMPQR